MFLISDYIFNRRLKYNVSLYSLKQHQNLSIFLILNLKKYINFILLKDHQLHIFVNKDFVFEVCFFLKNSVFTFCNSLLDITAVDRIEFLKDGYRWEYVYVFLSTYYNLRIFVRGYLKYYQFLPSMVSIFSSAN